MAGRLLRRLVPSVPVLARTPLAALLDVADSYVRRGHPEWAKLPPASLRMRIGVGNRILNNHDEFIAQANGLVRDLSERGYLATDSQVLELGCGCGRNARAFAAFLNAGGSYTGQDVDAEMIAWCQQNLATDKVSFHHADLMSLVYNPNGKSVTDYRFPGPDHSLSLIFAVSVFSHLLYRDAEHYIREGSRVLKKDGLFHMTWFVMDFIRPILGQRWTFSHAQENCYVESLRYPEAAVAFDLAVIQRLLDENGLALHKLYNEDRPQLTLIARKL